MKNKKTIAVALFAIFATVSAFAQETVINVTGASAFRAASHNAILNMLGGDGVTEYAFVGTQGLGGSNRAIFSGTVDGIPGTTIIRTSWSGSTAGIAAVLNATPVEVLLTTTTMTTAGNNVASPEFETAVAKFSFSDVFQAASATPTPALDGTSVGVIPFMFVANDGAPAELTNLTDQLHNALYASAFIPVSMLTSNPAHDSINAYAVGRNSGSGSRATMLAETGYGVFNPVQQFTGVRNAGTNEIETLGYVGTGGYSSNSGIRDLVIGTAGAVSVEGGSAEECVIISYLTISDAIVATQTHNARELTYNGVAYSEENVKNGTYTLWGYQRFYNAPGLTEVEETFKDSLVDIIPTTMGTAGIPIPDMNVTRFGGDGGQVLSN